jgi:hypothetical protein
MISENLKRIVAEIPEDIDDYLSFLVEQKFISSKSQALNTAIEMFKVLSMHEWRPAIYKINGSRVVLIETSVLNDFMQKLSSKELKRIARLTAIRKRLMNPDFKDYDPSNPENWDLILNDLEAMGWGSFKRIGDEVRIEFCAVPLVYVIEYLEAMFDVVFEVFKAKSKDIVILKARRRRRMIKV